MVDWSHSEDLRLVPVNKVIEALSDSISQHAVKGTMPFYSARVGEEMVTQGFSKIKGEKKSKRQSKHFVCTSCHNIEREDPDLSNPNPEDRLVYTNKKGLPFLQATTLYGAVNRTGFYNGDYDKKYGDLVKPARHDIREAIKLCAVECAQGRTLKAWEVESVLAYLWEIDLKMGDLDFSEEEFTRIENALQTEYKDPEIKKLIQSKYSAAGEIHFTTPPDDRKAGYECKSSSTENGALIYENSCLHCHYKQRYSYLNLDKSKMSMKYLTRKAPSYSMHSIYQVIRYGTYPKYGKKSYMPHYPIEKMSNQQVEDLRAYLAEASE